MLKLVHYRKRLFFGISLFINLMILLNSFPSQLIPRDHNSTFIKKLSALCWIGYAPSQFHPRKQIYPSFDSIKDDLQVLKKAGFNGVITFGAEKSLDQIPKAAKDIGFEGVIMGIWAPNSREEVESAIAAQNYVDGYCVGHMGLNINYNLETLKQAMASITYHHMEVIQMKALLMCRFNVCLIVILASVAFYANAEGNALTFYESFENLQSVEDNGGILNNPEEIKFTEGLVGNAIDFSGGKRACYPLSGRLDLTEGTVEFWVKSPALNHLGYFDVGALGSPSSIGIYKNRDHIIMEVKNNRNAYDQAWSANPIPSDGEWHFITGVWEKDGATTYYKVCVDGACKNNFDGTIDNSDPDPDGSFCVGWCGWYGDSDSQFDELKIYDYVKSDTEIDKTYHEYLNQYMDIPEITLSGDKFVTIALDEVFVDPGATAYDESDGDISAEIVVRGSVDSSTTGTYRIAYNVSDASGRVAKEKIRIVDVVDFTIDPIQRAYDYLKSAMDRYHQSFDIYTDFVSGGDHGTPSGWMGNINLLEIDPSWDSNCYNGFTCFRSKIPERIKQDWVGMLWLQPDKNWSAEVPNAGYDLTGATDISFYARGENGGEAIEFIVGGVTGDYPDSIQPRISTGSITLTKAWQRYTLDVSRHDLSHVIGLFGSVATPGETFYLDDVQYNLSRPDANRFIQSFEIVDLESDRSLTNIAFVYDNALVLMAFLARGEADDLRRAKILADTLLEALAKDRYYTDNRLRNAYHSGDLTAPFPDTARLPGWWDLQRHQWIEVEFDVGTHTGNMAWAMLALLAYYEKTGEAQYLDAVIDMAEWVEAETRDAREGTVGYTGGYEGWEPSDENPDSPKKLRYKSTEHNIDLIPVFQRLYRFTGDPKWAERSRSAEAFVESMWNGDDGHFWVGTDDSGIVINTSNIALDTQARAVMAMPLKNDYRRALNWAEQNCRVEADGFIGFDFNHLDLDGVWFEGTAQMALAFKINKAFDKAEFYLSQLHQAQEQALNGNGRGLVAASHDGVTTGFNWDYFSRLHIGATAWLILAAQGYNPYWGTIANEDDTIAPVNQTSANFINDGA